MWVMQVGLCCPASGAGWGYLADLKTCQIWVGLQPADTPVNPTSPVCHPYLTLKTFFFKKKNPLSFFLKKKFNKQLKRHQSCRWNEAQKVENCTLFYSPNHQHSLG